MLLLLLLLVSPCVCRSSLLNPGKFWSALNAVPLDSVQRLADNSSLVSFIGRRVQYRAVLFYVRHSRKSPRALRQFARLVRTVAFPQLQYAIMDLTDPVNRALRSTYGTNSEPLLNVWKSGHQRPHAPSINHKSMIACLAHLSTWDTPSSTGQLPVVHILNADAARHVSNLPSDTQIFFVFVRENGDFPYKTREFFASLGMLLNVCVLVSDNQPQYLMEMMGLDPHAPTDQLVLVHSNSFETWNTQSCDMSDFQSFKNAMMQLVSQPPMLPATRFGKRSTLLQSLYATMQGFWSGRYSSVSPLRVLLYAPGVGVDDLLRSLLGSEEASLMLDFSLPVTAKDVVEVNWLPPKLPVLLKVCGNRSHVFQGELRKEDLIQFIR